VKRRLHFKLNSLHFVTQQTCELYEFLWINYVVGNLIPIIRLFNNAVPTILYTMEYKWMGNNVERWCQGVNKCTATSICLEPGERE
jgi:hypothetical protein